jgi:hypothetical protein
LFACLASTLIHDDRAVPDGEGIILSGLKEAKEEAIKALPDMARDGLPNGDYR